MILCDKFISPKRIQERFEKFPVTIYTLTPQSFKLDGEKRCYGGYFSGKAFNPHIEISRNGFNISSLLHDTVASFFSQFLLCQYGGEERLSPLDVYKDCLKIYLNFYPEYKSYLYRLLQLKNSSIVIDVTSKFIYEALFRHGVIHRVDGKICYKKHLPDDFFNMEKELRRSNARFWAFGSVVHDADISFPDKYFSKSDLLMTSDAEKKVKEFLHE